MEKIIKLNLNNIISTGVNVPYTIIEKNNTKKTSPLYKRVDGEVESDILNSKGDDWVKKNYNTYSSPSNVKRLFITYKGVYVHLYKPVEGSTNKSLKREYKIKTNMLEVREDLIKGTNKYKVVGDGLSRLMHPWVIKNIEEIYFDWVLFLSTELDNIMGAQMFKHYGIGGNRGIDSDGMLEALSERILGDKESVLKQFPRLKCIGYFSNLEELYRIVPDKPNVDSLDDMRRIWAFNDSVKADMENTNSWTMLSQLRPFEKLIKEASVLSGIYCYDAKVLESYFNQLRKRIENQERNIDVENNTSALEQENNVKTYIEELMDRAYKNSAKAAKAVLISFVDGMKKEDKLKLKTQFTSEGQLKYSRILNEILK